uniref:Uncharacterized protein n=1 Tax=Anguilla anguilla TaxID=7936 RepID=A0A0E9VZ49_ANGAN
MHVYLKSIFLFFTNGKNLVNRFFK